MTGISEVRATTWLPKAPSELSEQPPALIHDSGRWYLTGLRSDRTPFHSRPVRFELGGPGELWRLP